MKDYSGAAIKINFKEVCYSCKHRETYLNEEVFYGDNVRFAVGTIIGCKHEEVCKEYLEAEK